MGKLTVEDLLSSARDRLPWKDDRLKARAKTSKTKGVKEFAFEDFMRAQEWLRAWDELHWAAERIDATCALSGMHAWPGGKNDRYMFWRYMADAARKMMS